MTTPIHPFPARMASEIALSETASLRRGSLVLDPMTGSGTVVRVASENGHQAKAFDMDPLSVLMTKVWTTPINTKRLRATGTRVFQQAQKMRATDVDLPWIDSDEETLKFINYWFGDKQQNDLRKISTLLNTLSGSTRNALQIALSRIIVTKKKGASLAWDVSHSRPHRVRDENDFNVIEEFLRSTEFLANRLEKEAPRGGVEVKRGDARDLSDVESCSVDAVITSPPYLNAIDYLRGHKLALVWFGYRIAELRSIRSESIGTSRGTKETKHSKLFQGITKGITSFELLPASDQRMFRRYVGDLASIVAEIYRVLRRQGRAVFVVGNSRLRDVYIDNALAVSTIANDIGFKLIERNERQLPTNRRYLPPPSELDTSDLKKRMRTEVVLRYKKP